jgi:hypothetical protein
MTKPVNHYASTTPMPDWLEAEIVEYLADIVINLGWALKTEICNFRHHRA